MKTTGHGDQVNKQINKKCMLINFLCLFCIKKLSVDLQFKRQVKTLPCTVTLGLELVSAGASLYPPEISVEKGTVAKKWCG